MTIMSGDSGDIPGFYRGRSLFITGATGFVGKALVERLLETCPEIGTIYILVREKKGIKPEQRLVQLKQDPVFEVVRAKFPQQLDKLVLMEGDIGRKNLGLTENDRLLLEKVSVVFHSAASVRFNEPLLRAVELNVTPTIELLQLCDTLPNIEAFIYVSTAYSNADRSRIEEILYPPPADLDYLLDLVKKPGLDEDLVHRLTASKPNTYTFTKAMAEFAVGKHGCNNFPVAVVRPPAVVASLQHPFPGWINGQNGPSGAIAGTLVGLMRVFPGDRSLMVDFVPVDIVADTLIAVAWETAVDKCDSVRVYNCCSTGNQLTLGLFMDVTNKYSTIFPGSNCLFYPHCYMISNRFIYKILVTLTQTIPLYLLDCILWIFNRNSHTSLRSTNSKMLAFGDALSPFTTRKLDFPAENTRNLEKRLSEKDKNVFNLDPKTIEWHKFGKHFVKGVRKFVLRDSEESLQASRDRVRKWSYILLAAKCACVLILFKVLWLSMTVLKE